WFCVKRTGNRVCLFKKGLIFKESLFKNEIPQLKNSALPNKGEWACFAGMSGPEVVSQVP
ncbi:MAG: hypothetical protein KDA77_14540, partial [Planctomycetaceae bacterium]|nr:hypothetical protein [Planctomycetaceae bacterium]